MYLDLHSHSRNSNPEIQTVQNIIIGEDVEIEIFSDSKANELFSVGIHPWYINEAKYKNQLDLLCELARHPKVRLIGECGFDRLRGPGIPIQEKVFIDHIEIAQHSNKTLVIHCVKCYSELLAVVKRMKPHVPLIIHGFNSKKEIATQLVKSNFKFSFGVALLNVSSNAASVINSIPNDSLFLETDDKDISIEEIYKAAAQIKNITTNKLKDIIFANWMSLI